MASPIIILTDNLFCQWIQMGKFHQGEILLCVKINLIKVKINLAVHKGI